MQTTFGFSAKQTNTKKQPSQKREVQKRWSRNALLNTSRNLFWKMKNQWYWLDLSPRCAQIIAKIDFGIDMSIDVFCVCVSDYWTFVCGTWLISLISTFLVNTLFFLGSMWHASTVCSNRSSIEEFIVAGSKVFWRFPSKVSMRHSKSIYLAMTLVKT